MRELDLDALAGGRPRRRRGRRRRRRGRSRSRGRASRGARAPGGGLRTGRAPRAAARAAATGRPRAARGSARDARGRARGRAPSPRAEPLAGALRARPGARRGRGRRDARPRSGSARARRRRGRRAARPARGRRPRRPGPGTTATARTTRSSLNGSRSSKLPPPRARITTSTPSHAREPRQRRDDRGRRRRPLDAGLGDDEAHGGVAGRDRGDDVASRRGLDARQQPDRAREARQPALALGREQALLGERCAGAARAPRRGRPHRRARSSPTRKLSSPRAS